MTTAAETIGRGDFDFLFRLKRVELRRVVVSSSLPETGGIGDGDAGKVFRIFECRDDPVNQKRAHDGDNHFHMF